MAEILVLAQSVHSNDDMKWCQGDITAIHEDGHVYGALEGLPRLWKIKIPGATVEECRAYTAAVFDQDGNMTKLRGRRLDYNTLPTPIKNTLDSTGEITVTKAQADAYVAQKA